MSKSMWLLTALLLPMAAYAGDYTYNAEDFKDTAKMAGKLTDQKFDKLHKWNINKPVIAEFAGEFLQSKEVTASAFAQMNADTTVKTVSTIKLGGDYYNSVLDRLYDMVSAALTEGGVVITPKENLASNEKYKALDLDFQKTTKGYTGGMFKDSVSSKGIKVSVEGLGLFPTSPLKAMKFVASMADMTNASGADGAFKVNFYINKGKGGSPVLQSFEIVAYGDLRCEERGFSGNKKLACDFYKQNETIFSLNKSMISKADISGATKGSVDMEKYDKALMELLGSAVDMMKVTIKAATAPAK